MPSLAEAVAEKTALKDNHQADAMLSRLMERPQRHRLLHGYPLAAAMPIRTFDQMLCEVTPSRSSGRGLLICVLPHPFCNPAVAGCGFCTFPHELYSAKKGAEVVARVVDEIERRVRSQPDLEGRSITALYFGGGTANLTPPDSFRALCRALASRFDLSQAEVTLEGVPAYFVNRRPLLVDILREEIGARHYRISMGIQSFDKQWLSRMGRLAFGTPDTFREVVELAHERAMTASADLLFNLPGQTLHEMHEDVDRAIEIGLDHVGLYHLVLFENLGTAWSHDRVMLASLPSNEHAADHWQSLREHLLAHGFDQTTLTNFERSELHGQARRFIYEECSFQPDRFDMLGFGPSGISFAADDRYRTGLKTMNATGSEDYIQSIESGLPVRSRAFEYGPRDLRIFTLTRRVAALRIDCAAYRSLFGTNVHDDFASELRALVDAGLVDSGPGEIRPTPRGMFYADSIAGLLAWRRIRAERVDDVELGDDAFDRLNSNAHAHM